MTFTNQQKMNDAIGYWSDGTLSIGSFSGENGFRRLLHYSVCQIDYVKAGEEDLGDKRLFLGSLDFSILDSRAGRRSLNFKPPRHRDPAPPGMLHIWDILMSGWRTIKVDDFGRVKINAIFPTSILPPLVSLEERSLSKFFSQQEIVDYERRVYGKIHNLVFHPMSGAAKVAVADEELKVTGLQDLEEKFRLETKEELDRIIDEKIKKETETPKQRLDDIQLTNPEQTDLNEAQNRVGSMQMNDVVKSDLAQTLGKSQSPAQNVVEELKQ